MLKSAEFDQYQAEDPSPIKVHPVASKEDRSTEKTNSFTNAGNQVLSDQKPSAFNNEGSDIYTIIEVDTRDRPGLLFDLTRTLATANVYINSAVIATYGAQVVDTFYVKDMFGLKFHSKIKQRILEKKLHEAIELGAERAIE